MEPKNQNQTQSERLNQEVSDNFDRICATLSNLPTDKAMKELSQCKQSLPVTRQLVETIALYKFDLVKAMRLMFIREKTLIRENEMLWKGTPEADKAIVAYLKEHPDFEL